MYINQSKIPNIEWWLATKTKPVRAKHITALLVDRDVLDKMLVETLEGNERLGNDVVICMGEANDVWQQTPKKLLQKYEVKEINATGWMLCEPRPENTVRVVQVTSSIAHAYGRTPPRDDMYKAHDFYIHGLWGADVPDFGKNIQWGMFNDYLCQSTSDPSDAWIVKKKIFENTYSLNSLKETR